MDHPRGILQRMEHFVNQDGALETQQRDFLLSDHL